MRHEKEPFRPLYIVIIIKFVKFLILIIFLLNNIFSIIKKWNNILENRHNKKMETIVMKRKKKSELIIIKFNKFNKIIIIKKMIRSINKIVIIV